MIILIKTELLKLKRSYMLLLCIAGSICAPLLNWLVFLNQEHYSGLKPNFYDYMINTNMFITIIIGTLLYGLFTTYIFEREFSEDMYKHLFTVPISKFRLLVSKIVVIMIGILFLTLVSFVFGVIFSLLSGFLSINSTSMFNSLIMYLKAYIAYIPLMIPVILVTLIFKSFVASIAFSIIIEIVLFIAMQSKYIALYPWSAPILLGTNAINDSTEIVGNISYNIFSIIAVGIISFIACIIYLDRKEIS